MRPLRDSPVLLPGLPLPDSRRTAHDFDVLLLSTSLTCSEHEPLWRMLQLRLAVDAVRSEEHTSELQSLMRISYAVFCLTKKKKTSTRSKPLTKHSTHNNDNI